MTDEVWKAINSIATLLAVLVGLIISIRNSRAISRTSQRVEDVHQNVEAVHQDVNGKMAQLLAATGASEHAKGEQIGREKAIAECANRVMESERVEAGLANIQERLMSHDEWER